MACAKIMEFPSMARPKIVRTAEEAAAVPLHLPIQVELTLDRAVETELFKAENELALAEKLVLAKKRVVEQLREALWTTK
jgi:hypothetical protein